MLLSVVVPTKNEARNIAACLACFDAARAEGWCEWIVVDNASGDGTADIARAAGARVFEQGPERSAQRNRGWQESAGRFVAFLDADMRMPPETLAEIRRRISAADAPEALYVRETRVGASWWIRVRNFERSFYDGTCIDALRIFSRSLLEKTGGYDPDITGFEDWDLDIRCAAAGARTEITAGALLHDEGAFTWRRHLRKKDYYAGFANRYVAKWGADHPALRRQLGLRYRFLGVFTENGKWKRVLRHPVLFTCVLFDRLLVGFAYVFARRGSRRLAGGIAAAQPPPRPQGRRSVRNPAAQAAGDAR